MLVLLCWYVFEHWSNNVDSNASAGTSAGASAGAIVQVLVQVLMQVLVQILQHKWLYNCKNVLTAGTSAYSRYQCYCCTSSTTIDSMEAMDARLRPKGSDMCLAPLTPPIFDRSPDDRRRSSSFSSFLSSSMSRVFLGMVSDVTSFPWNG